MTAEKPPAFQFYPKDFLSSDAVSLMTTEQIGAYTLLLCHSWLRPEGLPADTKSLAKLARVPASRFTSKVWPGIARSFTANDHGLLYNPRMERGRDEQEAYREERSQSGKRGAATRWGVAQPSSENGSAIKEPMAKNSSSSSSASSSASSKEEGGADAPTPQPIHGRRNPDLLTYGPVKLWASQFRDEIVPLVATHYGGDRDAAYAAALAWVGTVDTVNQRMTPSRDALAHPVRWWTAHAAEKWGASAVQSAPRKWCEHEPECVTQTDHTQRWLDEQKAAKVSA